MQCVLASAKKDNSMGQTKLIKMIASFKHLYHRPQQQSQKEDTPKTIVNGSRPSRGKKKDLPSEVLDTYRIDASKLMSSQGKAKEYETTVVDTSTDYSMSYECNVERRRPRKKQAEQADCSIDTDESPPMRIASAPKEVKIIDFVKEGASRTSPCRQTPEGRPSTEMGGEGRRVRFEDNAVLFDAARRGDVGELVRVLHEEAASVDAQNETGMTALHCAAANGRDTSIAVLLRDFGASVNVREENGWTPLHEAVMSESLRSVQVLLEYGADVEAEDGERQSPLCMATGELKGVLQSAIKHKYHADTVCAIYDYEAVEPDEMSLRIGERVVITNRSGTDWWMAEQGDRSGLVPRTHVQ